MKLYQELLNPDAANHATDHNMNASQWSSYHQTSYVNSGSHELPHTVHREDKTNNYGSGNNTSLLLPSCQGLQSLSRATSEAAPNSVVSNTNYNSDASSNMQSSKEMVHNGASFNGVCKESRSRLRNYIQTPEQPKEGNAFFNSEKTANYSVQMPSISFNSSSNAKTSTPGPFGVLPHETVNSRSYERNNEHFISHGSKNTAVAYNNGAYAERDSTNVYSPSAPTLVQSLPQSSRPPSTVSYNSGTYTERDASNVYSPAPLSVQSCYSGDTRGSLSPILDSVTSPNFSSPSDYYSSPKTNFGAYNSLQSPVPQSPSVAQHSYPSSPYTNIDHVSHISPAPPCSPMNGSTYVNNLNGVPPRNGLKTQHSPNNNNTVSNNILRYNSQSPSMTLCGPQSMLSNTADYRSDYNAYPQDQNSSSYSSLCPALHPGQISGVSPSRISPRTQSRTSIPHEGRMHYPHNHAMSSAAISSPSYLQNNVNRETLKACSSSIPSVPVHNSGYLSSSMNTYQNNSLHPRTTHMMSNHLEADRTFQFSSDIDDKKALDLFNSHVDSGDHNQQTSSIPSLLDMRILGADDIHTGQLESSINENNAVLNLENSVLVSPKISGYVKENAATDRRPTYEPHRGAEVSAPMPKKRGRKGRKRTGARRCTSLKNDTNNNAVFSSPNQNVSGSMRRENPNCNLENSSLKQNSVCSCQRKNPAYWDENCVDKRVIEQKLGGLCKMLNNLDNRRRTRNNNEKNTFYQVEFKSFLEQRKFDISSRRRGKRNEKIKLTFKKDPNLFDSWSCARNLPESASSSGMPSQYIKQEYDSEEESSNIGLFSSKTSKHSAKKRISSLDNYTKNKRTEFPISNINFPPLPAGRQKIKTEKESSLSEQLQRNMPKKFNRKTRESVSQLEANRKGRRQSVKTSEGLNPLVVTVKTEFPSIDEAPSERLRSLRSRRSSEVKPKEDPEPGPSIKQEPLDYGSDNWCETIDDTDSDPAWTPSKSAKNADSSKLLPLPGRKRGPKPSRRTSNSGTLGVRKRKTKQEPSRSRKKSEKSQINSCSIKETSTTANRGKKSISERFLIAKTDLHLKTPYIWKVDKKSSMLQRYEVFEQNGVLLYHSSFTYAAGNEISVNKYVTAEVRIKSADIVQYLGPNLSAAAEMSLSEMEPRAEKTSPPKGIFDELKDDFSVYIQSLLSQDVDASFFHEIMKFNDDYFLVPIRNIEAVSEEKKKNLMKDFQDEKLRTYADTYPCVNVLSNTADSTNCEVCKANRSIRLLQFYGQPYDCTTLSPVETTQTKKPMFNVCDKCSISVSLYNRLHHQKYNLFTKCHAKAHDVKENKERVLFHEDVLKLCLEDTDWIDCLFQEQIQIWKESDEVS